MTTCKFEKLYLGNNASIYLGAQDNLIGVI